MKFRTIISSIFVALCMSVTFVVAQERPVELVNPFIGTDNYGTTNPNDAGKTGEIGQLYFVLTE